MTHQEAQPSRRRTPDEDFRDRLYRDYGDDRRGKTKTPLPASPYFTQLVKKHFPTDFQAAVLDLGCGAGELVRAAEGRGYTNVEGIDRSAAQVLAARTAGIDRVSEGDALLYLKQVETGSIDALVAIDLLEHLSSPEVLELLDDAHRVLKPSGRFLAHVPNGVSPFAGRALYGDFTHVQAFTARSIRQVFGAAGFSRVECHEDRPVVHGILSAARAASWQILRAALWTAIAVESGPPRGEILSQNLLAVAFVR